MTLTTVEGHLQETGTNIPDIPIPRDALPGAPITERLADLEGNVKRLDDRINYFQDDLLALPHPKNLEDRIGDLEGQIERIDDCFLDLHAETQAKQQNTSTLEVDPALKKFSLKRAWGDELNDLGPELARTIREAANDAETQKTVRHAASIHGLERIVHWLAHTWKVQILMVGIPAIVPGIQTLVEFLSLLT